MTGAGASGGSTSGTGSGGGECALPWWGTPLEGTPGLLSCPESADLAVFAYTQTHFPDYWQILERTTVGQTGDLLSCCYGLDQRSCDSDADFDICVDVPHFGDGKLRVELPAEPVPARPAACDGDLPTSIPGTIPERGQALVGLWLACDDMPLGVGGEGILFQGDGSFHTVTRNSEGRLEKTPGCRQAGIWGIGIDGNLSLYIEDTLLPLFPGAITEDALQMTDFNFTTTEFVRYR